MNSDITIAFNVFFLAAASAIPAMLPATIMASALHAAEKRLPWREVATWCAVLYGWFAAALYITKPDIFGAMPGLVNAFGFPILFGGGVVLGSILILAHPVVRRRTIKMPLHWPVALQTARLIGGSFILWAVLGHATWVFALVAGLGDILVGATAPVAARALTRGSKYGRRIALAHTILGMVDFTVAIGTAFVTHARVDWPGTLIPGFLVPIATLIHIWTLATLWRTSGIMTDRSALTSIT